MLAIANGTVHTPDRCFNPGVVLVEAGRVAAVGDGRDVAVPRDAERIDASGLHVTPGFIDLQVNGAFGHDFTDDPTTIWQVAAALPRYGVTSFLPTIITSPLSKMAEGQHVVLGGRPADFLGSAPLGIHAEGPFLNVQKKGAHNGGYLRAPNVDDVPGWSRESGMRLVTLAPELPGAHALIRALCGRGVLVSAGHSIATYDQALEAFDTGVRYGTHLFNAMPALQHREPALPGALLTDPRPIVGFIADGIHTHPSIVRMVWRALGPARLNLVTDCMAAVGMPPGIHRLGDYAVVVDEKSARLAPGTLAGSVLTLDQALRNVIAFAGCSLEEALPTMTTTAARAIGEHGTRGRLEPGYLADIVLLSPDLHVQTTIVAGEIAYTATR
ncbi:MAG: N-acetylglucosamine-6-phosphate deacetylase [Bacteroidales bacterium]